MGVSKFSDEQRKEIATMVIDEISSNSLSLRKAVKKVIGLLKCDFVAFNTVYSWIVDLEMTEQYARAMSQRADNIFEEILDIVDCEDHDMVIDENGMPRVNNDVINRDRLRVDARKWMLGKMQPKKYGDKIDVTSDGEKINTTIVNLGSGIRPPEDE